MSCASQQVVVVCRRSRGTRMLGNVPEVAAVMRREGWIVREPNMGNMTYREQVCVCGGGGQAMWVGGGRFRAYARCHTPAERPPTTTGSRCVCVGGGAPGRVRSVGFWGSRPSRAAVPHEARHRDAVLSGAGVLVLVRGGQVGLVGQGGRA